MQPEKCLISIIRGNTWIKSLLYVPKSMKYNTIFFLESIVDLVEHVCQGSRRKTLRGNMVHLDDIFALSPKIKICPSQG
jgi:hypothetical protein